MQFKVRKCNFSRATIRILLVDELDLGQYIAPALSNRFDIRYVRSAACNRPCKHIVALATKYRQRATLVAHRAARSLNEPQRAFVASGKMRLRRLCRRVS